MAKPKPKASRGKRARDKDDGVSITLRTGGRPTTCTPAITRSVALLVATGNTIPVACEAVGLPVKTVEAWMSKGRDGLEPYADFVAAMDEAKATFEAMAVRGISVAGRADWKASAWLLERRAGERWRPPSQRSEHTGANGGPVQFDLTGVSTADLQVMLTQHADDEQTK